MKDRRSKRVIMYSTRSCSDCRYAKLFLTIHRIPYEEVDIDEDEESAEKVLEWSGGRRVIPTFEIHSLSPAESPKILHNPRLKVLAEELGISS